MLVFAAELTTLYELVAGGTPLKKDDRFDCFPTFPDDVTFSFFDGGWIAFASFPLSFSLFSTCNNLRNLQSE